MKLPFTSFRSFAASLSFAVLAASGAQSVAATPVESVLRGSGTVTLDPTILQDFSFGGVTVTGITPATYSSSGVVATTLVGGFVQTSTAFCELITGGGFQFKAGSKTVSITNLILNIPNDGRLPATATATVTADLVVNGVSKGRMQLVTFNSASLGLHAPLTVPSNLTLTVAKASLKISSTGAADLNAAIGFSVFSAGQTFGSLGFTIVFGPKTL